LKDWGLEVLDCSRPDRVPVLLVRYHTWPAWIALLCDNSVWDGSTVKSMATTRYSFAIAVDARGVKLAVTNREYLSREQKQTLATLLARDPKDTYTQREIHVTLFGENT
jgi:hypothetical protein